MPCRLLYLCAVFGLLAFSVRPSAALPKPVSSDKSMVTIKVDFVIVKTADLDALGINFGLVPLSVSDTNPPATPRKPLFLEYATGNIVPQLYYTLTRSTARAKVVSAPAVSTLNKTPVTISVDEAVPDFTQPTFDTKIPAFLPQVTRQMQVQGSITLIPRVNVDHSITLAFGLPPTLLRTIPSGGTLVISGIVSPSGGGSSQNSVPSVVSVGGHMSPDAGQTLLIFITPTIANPKP